MDPLKTYRSPFSAAYWREAARQLHNTRILPLAALFIALSVGLRAVAIPIGPELYLMLTFLPNAVGGMIAGPVVALFAGAASDVLGYVVNPLGGAFFPMFTLIEMLGSFLYALFLWRAPMRFWRFAAAKFSVNLVCNILLTPIANAWMMGRGAAFASLLRIVKNVALFPLETVLLVLCCGAIAPYLKRCRALADGQAVRLSARHFAALGALLAASAAGVALYYLRIV